jgi:chaperone BCS1
MDDSTLWSAIGELPSKCIALMEDIDAAFHRGITREAEDTTGDDDATPAPGSGQSGPKGPPASRVTLSGLLNALDGVGAQEGRILFATTNRYTALDDALIRPGRLDLHIEFKFAQTEQIRDLFTMFYQPFDELERAEKAAKGASGAEKFAGEDKTPDVDLIDLGPVDASSEKSGAAPPTPSSSGISSPSSSPLLAAATAPMTSVSAAGGAQVAARGTSHSARAPALSTKQYDELAQRFAETVPVDMFSMATLQGYLMVSPSHPCTATGS